MKWMAMIMVDLVSSNTLDISARKPLKTCTLDDIVLDCNGQMHFSVENCQINDSSLIKAVGTTDSKCSMNSNQIEFEYGVCGTSEILNENEIIYTITLGHFLSGEGIIFNNKRTFACKVPRKHTVSTRITIKKPPKDQYEKVGNIIVAKQVAENLKPEILNRDEITSLPWPEYENDVAARNDNAEVTTMEDFIDENGDMYPHSGISIETPLSILLISFSFI